MSRKFFTVFERQKTPGSAVGSHMRTEYGYQIDDLGVKKLVPQGETDVHAMIQASRDSVDINNIMSRYENGDVNALNRVKGFYADVSDSPTSLIEMYQRVNDAEKLFNSLDVDIRSKFNNSASEFWASVGTPEFDAVLGTLNYTDNYDNKNSIENSDNLENLGDEN